MKKHNGQEKTRIGKVKLTPDVKEYIEELVRGTDWQARKIGQACGLSHQSIYALYPGGLKVWRKKFRDADALK